MSDVPQQPSTAGGFRLCWLVVILVAAGGIFTTMWVTTRLQAADARSESLHTELRLAQLALASERQHREAETILARHASATPLSGYRITPLAYQGSATPPPVVLLWDMAQRRAILCGGPLENAPAAGPMRWEITMGGQSLMAGALQVDTETNTFCATGTAAMEIRPGESIVLQLTAADSTGSPLRWQGRLPSAAR